MTRKSKSRKRNFGSGGINKEEYQKCNDIYFEEIMTELGIRIDECTKGVRGIPVDFLKIYFDFIRENKDINFTPEEEKILEQIYLLIFNGEYQVKMRSNSNDRKKNKITSDIMVAYKLLNKNFNTKIKKAYKKLSRLNHPDKTKNDEDKEKFFKCITIGFNMFRVQESFVLYYSAIRNCSIRQENATNDFNKKIDEIVDNRIKEIKQFSAVKLFSIKENLEEDYTDGWTIHEIDEEYKYIIFEKDEEKKEISLYDPSFYEKIKFENEEKTKSLVQVEKEKLDLEEVNFITEKILQIEKLQQKKDNYKEEQQEKENNSGSDKESRNNASSIDKTSTNDNENIIKLNKEKENLINDIEKNSKKIKLQKQEVAKESNEEEKSNKSKKDTNTTGGNDSTTSPEENKTDTSTTSPEEEKAATKIQKNFRGFLARNKDPLKDLEKDFPNSKESSISFPSIDKVNKKLSDLFDYIEKNTMEEFEETKELEKQQIEAEIEKTRAETTKAIRESERKFGMWRSDREKSTGIREEKYEDDDDEIKWNDDDDDDFEVRNKETFKTNDDYKNKFIDVNNLEWDIDDLDAILNEKSNNLQKNFTITDLEKISANMEEKYNDEDNLQSRIKDYIEKEKKGNKIENVFLYTIYTNLGLLKSDEKKVTKLIDDDRNYIYYNKQNIVKASKKIKRIKDQLGLSEKAINSYIGNIFQILEPSIEQIKKFDEGITATSTKLNEKQEGTEFEKYTDRDIEQCCEKDGVKDDEKRELLQKLKSYNKITQEEEKRKLLYELLKIDNLGNTFSDKINEIKLENLKQIFRITSKQIINLIKKNITNDTDYKDVLTIITKVLKNKFEEIKKSKSEKIKEIEEKIKTINDNISSAEKDLEQLEQDLIIIKEKIKENNERIEEATTQATIYKNQKEIIKKYKEFYGLNLEASLNEIKEAMKKKYKTIIDDVKKKSNVISKKFKALWDGASLDTKIKKKCSEKFKNLIDNKVNFETFEMKNFIEFHEQVFGIYLEYYPVKNVINLATYGSGWKIKQQNAAKGNLENIQEDTQLGDLIQKVQLGENSRSYGPFYKVLHTSSKNPKKLYYNVEEDFNRLTKSDSDIDHIIYAGYGFSGSGKTYTLVEKDNPNSILNQIEVLLEQNEITPEIKTYSRYAEIYDNKCNNAIDNDYPDKKKLIKIKENFDPYQEGSISGYIENINKKRKKTRIGKNDNLFRTSIRKTPNNVESSRSHLFIDIILNVNGKDKIITLLDMAGNEDASVIQKDYFESLDAYKVEYKQLGTKIENLKKSIKENASSVTYNDLVGSTRVGQHFLIIKNTFIDLKKYIKTIITKDTSKSSYKINVEKWKELFNDIKENGPGERSLPSKSERNSFIKNYNYYQMLEIVLVIKNIYEAFKTLEKPDNKDKQFCHNENTTMCVKSKNCISFLKTDKSGTESSNKDIETINTKRAMNSFFNEILGNSYFIENFNVIEELFEGTSRAMCNPNPNTIASKQYKGLLILLANKFKGIFKRIFIDELFNKEYKKEYERYIKEKDTTEFWNNIESYVAKKKEWDKKIIGKYHCPLRFQGNAINDSIDNLKRNLQEINNTKDTTYTSGTFPFDVWKEQEHHSENYKRKNYVIFTNVRLDLSHSISIGKAYDISLKFSEELVSDTKRRFGKKVSKKTSTRSFRKRGRRRGPSETEIL